ncbi:MAG: BrnT family toxin [Deltaproteobacteria bacterium]|nr:BrnT family toxin [Deltaproteobacteria bacterium]
MKIRDIIWLDEVVEKLAWKHGVVASEVEDVVRGRCRIFKREKGRRVEGEDLYLALGVTYSGRYLAVFFILKQGGEALVVTARDMKKCERRLYEEKH